MEPKSGEDVVQKATIVELGLTIGQTFKTYTEMENTILSVCKQKFLQYYKRDSRTIEKSAKRNTRKKYNPAIRYSDVRFACIHGGREFISSGTGKRQSTTFRNHCPAFIKIKATPSGSKLMIDSLCNQHNHLVNESLFQMLPHNRIETKIMKKRVTQINAPLQFQENPNDDVLFVIKNLKEKDVDVREINDDDSFVGLIFSSPYMKSLMAAYAELLCIDVLPIRSIGKAYIFFIQDGNGANVIISVACLGKEVDQSSMLKIFKAMHPSWEDTKIVITSKSCDFDCIIKKEFPSAIVATTMFHFYKTFRRRRRNETSLIRTSEKNFVFPLMEKMFLGTTTTELENFKDSIYSSLSSNTITLFEENWESMKNELDSIWGELILDISNNTRSILQNLNPVLNGATKKYSFGYLVYVIFSHIESSQYEINFKILNMLQKRPSNFNKLLDPQEEYEQYLTMYASQKIKAQIKNSRDVEVLNINDDYYQVQNVEKVITVTPLTCNCNFFQTLHLPCSHIFAVRAYENLTLFDECLCDKKWTLSYFKSNLPFSNLENEATEMRQERVFTKEEKYRRALIKCKMLASAVAESSTTKFEERMDALDELLKLWTKDVGEGNEFCKYVSEEEGLTEECVIKTEVMDIEEFRRDELYIKEEFIKRENFS